MGFATLTPLQPYRNLADLLSASTARTNLGLAIGSDVQAYSAQTASLASLGTNGGIYRTASNTITARTLTGTSNQVVVTNGDGVSGNPTLSLPQSIATTSDLTFGSVLATDGSSFSGSAATPNLVAIKTFTATSGSYSPLFIQSIANPSASSSEQVRALSYVVQATGANNLTNSTGGLVGFRSDIQHLGTSVVTAACGGLIGSPFRTSSGSWTDVFGMRIQTQKATGVTRGWGVYAEGTDDANYFAGNTGIGASSWGTNAAKVLAIANGTAPTTYPHVQLCALSGELNVYDTAGNNTVLSNHKVDEAIAAGIVIDFNSDPVPDVYYSRNPYIGKEKFRYISPNGVVQVVYRDLPPREVRDWKTDQQSMQSESEKRHAEWRESKRQHPERCNQEADGILRKSGVKVGDLDRQSKEFIKAVRNREFLEPEPEVHAARNPPQWMVKAGVKA